MATSYTNYTGDGSNTDYTVTFSYLAASHVFVSVNGTGATFTWLNATTVRMDAAPASGAVVKVYRATDPVPLVDFVDAAVLFETDLDTSVLQSLFIAEEAKDAVANSSADADAAAASAVDASVSAAAAAASAITAATEADAAAASAAAAALFDPASYYTKTEQDVTDAAQDAVDALKAPLASPAFTGDVSFAGEAQFDGVTQLGVEVLTSSAAIALSLAGASKKTLSLAHNTTITVSGAVANQTVEVWITSTGSFTAAWAGVTKWVGGSAPTLSVTSGEIDVIFLSVDSAGTVIVGSHPGAAS